LTPEQLLNCTRVVFLDFDGVLNSDEYSPPGDDGFAGISSYHVKYLTEILDQTGACVVLTTSWRNDHNKANPYEYAVQALINVGLQPGLVRGMTPVLPPMKMTDYTLRGREIAQWLKDNPNITHYVILDDTFEFTKEQAEHLVQTELWEGLRKKHVKQAVDILLDKAYN